MLAPSLVNDQERRTVGRVSFGYGQWLGVRRSKTMMSVLEVSESRLLGNVRSIQGAIAEASPGAEMELLAVVKADGYGHSARVVAPLLVGAAVRWLGVTDAEEGAAVRRSVGTGPEILVMSGPPGDRVGALAAAEDVVKHRLTPVIWTVEQMRVLAEAAVEDAVGVHVEVDTGMSRQGVLPGRSLDALMGALRDEGRVRVDGVMTHLASSECADGRQTKGQMELFEGAIKTMGAAGVRPRWVHVGNASTIDNASVEVLGWLQRVAGEVGTQAMVRCGLGLYGLCMPVEGVGESRLREVLRPVLTWRTSVVAVQDLAAGGSIGYGASYTARQGMRVALLPVGYADGLRRGLSGTDKRDGGWVMIRGRRAAIVGRVSMNLTTVDVTDFEPMVAAGERVVLLGDGVTAEDHAGLCGVLPYEILCGLRGRAVAG